MKTLLNKMFTGNYLEEPGNIGHEIINLFKADPDKDGKEWFYIYAMPDGLIGAERDDTVDQILLVRNAGQNRLQVIATVQGIEQIAKIEGAQQMCSNDRKEEIQKKIKHYIKDNEITYFGVRLDKIFENNTYQGRGDISSVPFTFKAEKYFLPVTPLFLILDPKNNEEPCWESYQKGGEGIVEVHLMIHQFHETAFLDSEIIDALLEAVEWKPYEFSFKDFSKTSSLSFLNIIQKEYSELAYSNMLAYFLSKDKSVLSRFIQDVLGIQLPNGKNDFRVRREHNNIDLLIDNESISIIIENKIKSEINGNKYADDGSGSIFSNQLAQYVKKAVCERYEATGEDNNYPNDKNYETQWKFIKDKGCLKKFEDEIKCYILCPEYYEPKHPNLNDVDNDRYAKKYVIRTYKKIYEFFTDKANSVLWLDPYFPEFIKALEIHSRDIDDLDERIMKCRFSDRLNQLK